MKYIKMTVDDKIHKRNADTAFLNVIYLFVYTFKPTASLFWRGHLLK